MKCVILVLIRKYEIVMTYSTRTCPVLALQFSERELYIDKHLIIAALLVVQTCACNCETNIDLNIPVTSHHQLVCHALLHYVSAKLCSRCYLSFRPLFPWDYILVSYQFHATTISIHVVHDVQITFCGFDATEYNSKSSETRQPWLFLQTIGFV